MRECRGIPTSEALSESPNDGMDQSMSFLPTRTARRSWDRDMPGRVGAGGDAQGTQRQENAWNLDTSGTKRVGCRLECTIHGRS